MGALAHFHLIRPLAIGLVPLSVVIWWLWSRSTDPLRGWRSQMDPELLKALTVVTGGARRSASVGLLAAWILASVSVAGPTWRREPSPFADDATPVMVLLKADVSMETDDPSPSRIEIARLKVADLARARKGQPLGLIAYAGSAHLVLPPTRDTDVVATMAGEISPEIMPVPGDRLDLAIRRAGKTLQHGGELIAFADSIGSDPKAVTEALQGTGLPLTILAIGTEGSDDLVELKSVAGKVGATVEQLTPDDSDVSALVRAASHRPEARAGEGGSRWQETGYWLVPVVALLGALSFRRKVASGEAAP